VRTPQATEKKFESYGPQQKPPDPPLPPLTLPPNVKFYGFGTMPNSTSRRAYIHDGDEVYIVGEGDILLKRFRIVRIGNDHLEFEEISTGRVGTAPFEEQPAGSQP
jgi:Tfp pilus assembly protein PilP